MDWNIKYKSHDINPWSVYSTADGEELFEAGFKTKEEAENWVAIQRQEFCAGDKAETDEKCDAVEEADIESFPASDPPSWTGVTAK